MFNCFYVFMLWCAYLGAFFLCTLKPYYGFQVIIPGRCLGPVVSFKAGYVEGRLIPSYSNNSSEATQCLAQLHEIVAKILQSNYEIRQSNQEISQSNHEIRQSNHEMSIQLSELIKRNDEDADVRPPIALQPNAEHDNEYASNYTPGTLLTPGSSTTDFGDDTSSIKGDTMLSDMSLGGLSVSEISVLGLRICLSDLHDSTPFQQASAASSKQGWGRWKFKWSLRGRLHSAISTNSQLALIVLINLGADLEEVDSNGDTPLLVSIKNDIISIPILQLLLNSGANANSTDSAGRTPLSYAAAAGLRYISELLLEKGANVNSPDSTGRTPLSYAAEAGQYFCEFLLEKGANADSSDSTGRTPLSYAVTSSRPRDISDLLLGKGANVNSADATGRTPLSYAAETGLRYLCKFLLEKGANVNSPDSTGRTPLSYAVTAPKPRDLCDLLLGKGANVNSADATGRTPLSYAAETGLRYLCEFLLQKGANVNSPDSTGRTPLSYAITENHKNVCNLLKNKGAIH